jgi:histidinol-phosphate/aromatic aminotransferase/cobyric acid decarboxylase-like protein
VSAIAEIAGRRVADLRRYRPGKGQADEQGKLSSNEAPLGPAGAVRDAIAAAGRSVHRYATSESLRGALAAALAVSADHVVVTSGSD